MLVKEGCGWSQNEEPIYHGEHERGQGWRVFNRGTRSRVIPGEGGDQGEASPPNKNIIDQCVTVW